MRAWHAIILSLFNLSPQEVARISKENNLSHNRDTGKKNGIGSIEIITNIKSLWLVIAAIVKKRGIIVIKMIDSVATTRGAKMDDTTTREIRESMITWVTLQCSGKVKII